jgi:hypothetical protein
MLSNIARNGENCSGKTRFDGIPYTMMEARIAIFMRKSNVFSSFAGISIAQNAVSSRQGAK